MLEIVIGIIVGMFLAIVCVAAGAYLAIYNFRKGAILTDNVFRDKAPFDDVEKSLQPFDSHTDGGYLDEDDEDT